MNFFRVALLLLLAALLSACGSGDSPTPTAVAAAPTEAATATLPPTDTPTAEPTATLTPLPTDTPTPPPTATPTETPTPTPVPVVSVLVTDLATGQPIPAAVVEISSADLGVTFTRETDSDGLTTFELQQGAVYEVAVTAEGYQAATQSEVTLDGMVDLALELEPEILAEIAVDGAALRAGPGTVYAWLGTAESGTVYQVIGQNADGTWLQVDRGEEADPAWIFADNVTVSGQLDGVTAVEAPPTPMPTATPAAPQPTATPAQVDTVTFYYRSNPNEILGTFPVYEFNGQALYNSMVRLRNNLQAMSGAINAAKGGDAAACQTYVNAYNGILYSGAFYDNVPPDWGEIHGAYIVAFIYALDRTRPAFLSCANAGSVDDFNYNLAVQTIGETLGFVTPYVNAAAAKVGG